jgi:hypothetical protein
VSSAVGGTGMNMASQALVQPAVDLVVGRKMVPVPPEVLVPQSGPDGLTPAEQALRAGIAEKQQALMGVGSVSNTAVGAIVFGLAQAGRLVTEAAHSKPPRQPDDATPPQVDVTKSAIGVGAGVAVSFVGGALMGTAMGVQMARAKVRVPDPFNRDQQVEMKLFRPVPTQPAIAPPYTGNLAQVAGSVGMRLANLMVASVPLQTAASVARVSNAAIGGTAQVAGMIAAAATYFQGLGMIGGVEGARQEKRKAAAAAAAAQRGGDNV